ncbi:hypothetical protein B5G52_12440 [Pseudoalteromonas sp. A601]|uniref:hypothetical protein n=1 Tax=Pseudoalteromonas sp. A601 TaxID=1967839 RepID=UPI000B3CF7A9|nr:hypothetical protein [Pseudoalteromonas sp. A601]OUS71007.1 hypothetical protein B5G52_12440 [Pseudoalteromonas sp. A601]
MNSKVGIFWFVENTLVYKTQNAIDLKPDLLGFVDSSLQHQIEWEENLLYEQFALSRGRSKFCVSSIQTTTTSPEAVLCLILICKRHSFI